MHITVLHGISLLSLTRVQIQPWERQSQPYGFHCVLLLLTPGLYLGIHSGILLLFSDGVYNLLACSLAGKRLIVELAGSRSPPNDSCRRGTVRERAFPLGEHIEEDAFAAICGGSG